MLCTGHSCKLSTLARSSDGLFTKAMSLKDETKMLPLSDPTKLLEVKMPMFLPFWPWGWQYRLL